MRKLVGRPLLSIALVLLCGVASSSATQIRSAASGARLPLLGDASVEPHLGTLGSGRAEAFRVRARGEGTVARLSVFVGRGSTARKLVVGIYSDAHGRPGRLISSGHVSPVRARAWNTVSITARRLLAGRAYWLAVLARGGQLRLRYARPGRCSSQTSGQGHLRTLRSAWRAGTSRSRCPISAFATVRNELGGTVGSPTPGGSPLGAAPGAAVTALTGSTPLAKAVTPGGAPAGGSPPGTAPGEAPAEAPAEAPPASPACTMQTSSVSAAASMVASAPAGAAICLTPGSYGQLSLSGAHSGNVTVESVPGTAVSLAEVKLAAGTSNLTIHNFSTRQIFLAPGDSNITIDHNDISGGGEGVVNSSVNCSSPNAPTYEGCMSTAPDRQITIIGNKIHGYGEGGGEDAIHLSNWEGVTITANDIYNLEEHGNHTDAFQSVFGGSGMLFNRNYEHDNQCQGFFIKDGDASNVTVSDNLFLRNDNLGEGENNIQVFNTTGFVMTKNTVWDGQGDLIRSENAAGSLTANVNHNVEQLFSVLNEGGPTYSLTEDYDIFKEKPSFSGKGAHSTVVAKPSFVNPAVDDYRLASNPNNVGVDWTPSEYVYGPTGN